MYLPTGKYFEIIFRIKIPYIYMYIYVCIQGVLSHTRGHIPESAA